MALEMPFWAIFTRLVCAQHRLQCATFNEYLVQMCEIIKDVMEEEISIKRIRKAKDNTGLTLQNFTWIWSKFIVYTGYIYKIWNQGRAKTEKQTLDTTEVLAKSIYRYVIY